MFEKKHPNNYKCEECKFSIQQFEEKILNIKGTVKKITVWFPLCLYSGNFDIVYLAIEKCKKFEKKE